MRPLQLPSRYLDLQEIGRGGAAVVYSAFDSRENRPVAIKVLHEKFIGNREIVKRFHREAKLMLSLSHPNMVQLFDFVAMPSKLTYLVMEYVYGWSLRDIIRLDKGIRHDVALPMLYQIAQALAFAHGKGIIHRDLKPQNILISKNGEVKLTDFGIAKALHRESVTEDLTRTGHFVGTPLYSSPEQIAGDKNLDARSDIYSLGCILYEIYVGLPPFQQSKMEDLLDAIAYGDYKSLKTAIPSLHSRICKFHEKLMSTKAEKRYQTMDEVIQECFEILQVGAPADIDHYLKLAVGRFGDPTSPVPPKSRPAPLTMQTEPAPVPVLPKSKVVPLNPKRVPEPQTRSGAFRIPQLPARAWAMVIVTVGIVYAIHLHRIHEARQRAEALKDKKPLEERPVEVTEDHTIAPAPWVPPVIKVPEPVLPPNPSIDLVPLDRPRPFEETRKEKESLIPSPSGPKQDLIAPRPVAKAYPYGFVTLQLDIPANVDVNGETQQGPKRKYANLPIFSSTAVVKVRIPGMDGSITMEYKVNRDQETPVQINLTKDYLGKIQIEAERGVRVFLDDRFAGDSGQFGSKYVLAGDHMIQFVRQGQEPVWKKVSVGAGQTIMVRESP